MDIKTLVLALALGNLSLCAALFFFEYESKKSLSLSTWAVAKQLQAAAWFLLYFRGVLPDLLTGPLANVLLFAGMALDAGALWQAAGRPGWRRWMLPALAGTSTAYLACHFLDVAPGPRAAAGFLIVSGFFLSGVAALALAWRGGSMLRRYLVVVMAGLSMLVAGRGVLAATYPEGWSWVGPLVLQGVGFGALYLMMLTNAFGYLLLSREKLQAELARLEVVDPLTDVPNRRGFYQALAPWMALARRPGLPTALILLNLDQFKRVNDSYGHTVGDVVLKAMVEICKKQLRDSDLMGRLGGAEFAIQLPRTSQQDAAMVAERIRAAIASQPVRADKAMISLSASMGVTTIRADDSTVTLFKRADGALQQAMLGGANRVAEAPDATIAEEV
ncbi:diguanylate cyclase [Massilia sp. Root418]|jgi:diguanylate cyclase (GGDEF)-like protein|uniref:GGDEF domain-containing protein n=1 Tax=Massilia sp. Root418 TaxID=1736532 RepID=UPI0006FA010C|nr:GGDEF domain-containing protein [Massilia sp. Root418]KQW87205.1 diguanylate cyclase [Massilia sp. Root418]